MLRSTLLLLCLVFFWKEISANQKVLDVNSGLFTTAFNEYLQSVKNWEPSQLGQLRETFLDLLRNNGYTITDSSQSQSKTVDVNSPVFENAFNEYLQNAQVTNLNPSQRAEYKQTFTKLLAENGYTVTDSTPQTPQLPSILQPGLPAQANSQTPPAFISNRQQASPQIGSLQTTPPTQTASESLPPTTSSRLSQGYSGMKNTLFDAAGNQVTNLMDGTNEVIKGTDEVLDEVAYQFQGLNYANKEMLKQKARTKGTLLTKAPEVGTNWLKGVENFVEEPSKYLNPFNYLWNPFASTPSARQLSAAEIEVDNLSEVLKKKRKGLHIKLMRSGPTYQWLKEHPDVFQSLLAEGNWIELEKIVNNPNELTKYKN